jgi:signal transduction histidine kinase
VAVEPRLEQLERVVDEQAALRRIATLVATGATEAEIAAAVSSEVGGLFGAQSAGVVRWEGDTIRVIGSWGADSAEGRLAGSVLSFGGDTITARVVETGAPVRIDSAAELKTEFARKRWAEFEWQASIGAPIIVDRRVWGVVAASRREPGDTFARGDEERLRDFSALVALAITNAEARTEAAALMAEQSALRRIATLVAAGRPQAAVLDAVTAEAGMLFGAASVTLVRWEGIEDETVVVAAWCAAGVSPIVPRSLYHPEPGGPTLGVLETGASRRGVESSRERGTVAVIAAPVIANRSLFGSLTAVRAVEEPFAAGAETRLRSFADLAGQSIGNERARAELRSSRARIVQTSDEARRRLERNLHDGAQQRLVSVSLALRLVEQMLAGESSTPSVLLREAATELTEAMQELRELARGLHPAVLSDHGLGPALEALSERSPFPVEIIGAPQERRLPAPVEAAIYYVAAESLTNAVKHADASSARVVLTFEGDDVSVEIADDGSGGASFHSGSGLRGLSDRVEALGGELTVVSPRGGGTLVRADLPLREPIEAPPSFPAARGPVLSTIPSEVSWQPVLVLVSAGGSAGEEMLSLLSEEYGATGETDGEWWKLTIRPVDQFRRGTIIYRVIQASQTLARRHPDAKIYLVTEDGNRWTLPPPSLSPAGHGDPS